MGVRENERIVSVRTSQEGRYHGGTVCRLTLGWVAVTLAILVLPCSAQVETRTTVSFNRDVRPILSDKCFACHGFDAKSRQADLRLDSESSALAERNGVRALAPGDLAASDVWQRINSHDPDQMMPPPDSHKILSDSERHVLRTWIEEGAAYQKHWSFEPLRSVSPPVHASDQQRHPIDQYVIARLASLGFEMAPPADQRTLIRRVAFATTGLPPTVREVERYLADTTPGSYERMVDRYLESPLYGEEMARHWLDAARYADTHGMHLDNERQTWAYRDWVIRAFNVNVPFDTFTLHQLAGDLLPNPTQEQLVATGFNRCNVTSSEGGSINEEYLFRYAVDRTSTMVQVWMGLTAGCAVCHDHKFDPISQREYYSLYAFFYSAADPAMDGNALLTDPVLKLETPQQQQQRTDLNQQIDAVQERMNGLAARASYSDPGLPAARGARDAVADTQGGAPDQTAGQADDPAYSFLAWWRKSAGQEHRGLSGELGDLVERGPPADLSDFVVAKDSLVERLVWHYLQTAHAPSQATFANDQQTIQALRQARQALDDSIPSTFIFRNLAEPRPAFVMLRGAYNQPGEAVSPSVPEILPPLPQQKDGAQATRLDLAKWLVSPEHPLTARVTVNRLWQQFFGTGLVKTSYDFGSQGEAPTHPELLDWLALHFQRTGWDTKGMVRLILTSEAFRQDSQVRPDLAERDPENRWYGRGPRVRLDAEQIRDNALYVSGLICLEMGGKGVRTYQPDNIWEPVGFAGSNTRFYQRDNGASLYRRSIYTFLKRTAPPPFMSNFDAPNREQFCMRRDRSNTPLQALQLMNDIQHIEAARGLAQRMILEGGLRDTDRIRLAYQIVLARDPSAAELEWVSRQMESHRLRYGRDVQAAEHLVALGDSIAPPQLDRPDLAACTLVANMILNLDETLTRN